MQISETSNGTAVMNYPFVHNGYCVIFGEFFPYDTHDCYAFGFHSTHGVQMNPIDGGIIVNPVISVEHPSWWIRTGFSDTI